MIVFTALVTGRAIAAADVVVTNIRVGHHGEHTRFVLDLSKSIDISFFILDAPFRVVLDMPEVGWRLPAKPLPKHVGLFKTIRYGLYQAGQSRIVIEATQPVAVKTAFFLVDSGAQSRRFVLDLLPSDFPTFLASLNHKVQINALGKGYQSDQISSAAVLSNSNSINSSVDPFPVVELPSTQTVLLPAPVKPSVPSRSDKRVVVIDPGHGGADPGAIGASGIYEKHITIAMARQLKEALESSGRYRVVLTRDRDIFIKLRDRVDISRKSGADLFISLHADSIKNKKINGSSVYTLSEKASDKEAAMLAERENKVDLIAGIDLSGETQEVMNILIDLAQRESMNESASFANILVRELKRTSKVLRNTHRFAGFAVLKAPDIPSVLLELGFLSNPTDENNLRSKTYRQNLSRSILNGIDHYFADLQQARSN